MEQSSQKVDDNQTEIEEKPNDENIKHSNQKTEKDGIKKNQIIQKIEKTEGKKMKIRRIIRPKKIKITQVLEMTRSGLTNLFSLPIANHREGIYMKDYRRNSMKIVSYTHLYT